MNGCCEIGLFFDSGQNLTILWWMLFPYLFPYPKITYNVSFKQIPPNYTIMMEMLWEQKYHDSLI